MTGLWTVLRELMRKTLEDLFRVVPEYMNGGLLLCTLLLNSHHKDIVFYGSTQDFGGRVLWPILNFLVSRYFQKF